MFKNFISIFTVLIVVSMCGTAISWQTTTVDDNRAYLVGQLDQESVYVEASDPADTDNVRQYIKDGLITSDADSDIVVHAESKGTVTAIQKTVTTRPLKVVKPVAISR